MGGKLSPVMPDPPTVRLSKELRIPDQPIKFPDLKNKKEQNCGQSQVHHSACCQFLDGLPQAAPQLAGRHWALSFCTELAALQASSLEKKTTLLLC